MTTDVLCINLPIFEPNVVPSALAIIKGINNRHGITTKLIDFNLDWVDACVINGINWRTSLVGASCETIPNTKVQEIADQCIAQWVQCIVEQSPKVLAISVFTFYGQYFAHKILEAVKKQSPNIFTVIGGAGISVGILKDPEFALKMQQLGIADLYLSGPAEKTWEKFVVQHFELDVESCNDVFLDVSYVNDYSEFEFDRYKNNAKKFNDNYITNDVCTTFSTSEGCVRKCDFCEIHRFSTFRQRSAEQVKINLTNLMQHAGSCHIAFTDSLVNGNLKEFDRILDVLIDLKQQYPLMSWSGQYIVRGKQQYPERFYAKLAKSGVSSLQIGVETGSEKLRFSMNKRFTNADLDWTIEMLDKYNIQCVFLQFVGHPEETDQDFEDTKQMYVKYQHYAGKVIKQVQLNFTMVIQPNTDLYDRANELGLKFTADPSLWYATSNPSLTFEERTRRRILLTEHIHALGYKRTNDEHTAMLDYARTYSKYKYAIKIVNRN